MPMYCRRCPRDAATLMCRRAGDGSRAAAEHDGSPALCIHPAFPELPASVPLTYTLSMHACLSERPTERPTFEQVATLLRDVAVEVADGRYVNSDARVQVCNVLRAACISPCRCAPMRGRPLVYLSRRRDALSRSPSITPAAGDCGACSGRV